MSQHSVFANAKQPTAPAAKQAQPAMNFDLLIENPEITLAWLKGPMTRQFFSYLSAERDTLVARLSASTEAFEMTKLAGELRRLDKILQLPLSVERVITELQQRK